MSRILLFCLAIFFFASSNQSNAQSVDHVLGEYLVKINAGHDVHQLTADLQRFEGIFTKIRANRKLKTPWNIWKLSFDQNAVHEFRLLEELKKHPAVAVAQMNHVALMRQTIPNDTQFDQQWQWLNDGTNGAVADADVDAELAWDISTGGQTSDGDDIVVAVLDDGTDLSHPDLMANLWTNENEIPDNNVDDDNNGYVDDYNGWNIFNDDDDVSGGSHGVSVSGMIGAVGNNGEGVTGINWNVKIMSIKNNFATQEDLVLEAYAYPYKMRQLYNETNGAQGAFVVATNASWGVDFGDPADAPLWCEFYDDLGAEGVLNCGATSNAQIDIDVEGDLPTACPSDFMIAVTRSGSANDQGGGFGPMQIDLGAPGNSIYTTAAGGGYTSTTGTSFSSPLVAGIIGLLYSAPCNTLTALAKSDPQAAALAVRGYLLDNVTQIDGWETLVATGGVANAHLAIQAILDDCGPCPAPSSLGAENVTDAMGDLVWNDGPNATSTTLEWRAVGAADWIVEMNAVSPLSINGLMACTEYEFRVMNECADSSATSDFSIAHVFKTDGCCEAPAEIQASDETETTVLLQWTSVLAAESYNVRYRIIGSSDWLMVNETNSIIILEDLESCNDYEVQVQTICAGGIETEFGPLINFHAFGCGACEDLAYCEVEGNTNFEFIESVSLNSYSNTTGNDEGYALFSTPTVLFNPLEESSIAVTVGFVGGSFEENVVAWIDYNQDGEFSANEEILNSPTETTLEGTFVIPNTALTGLTRLRVKVSYQEDLLGSCDDGFEGEVEDYCIFINDGTVNCTPPQNIEAALSGNTATISFTDVDASDEYLVEYSPTGTNLWTSITATASPVTISDIGECGTYDVRITSFCMDIISTSSQVVNFTIPCPCIMPMNLDTISTTLSSITLTWEGDPNAIGYELNWKESTATDWISEAVTSIAWQAINLTECTAYDFRVKTVCADDESDYSEVITFSSACNTSTYDLNNNISLLATPNPFSNNFQLDLEIESSDVVNVFISDMTGKVVSMDSQLNVLAGKNSIQMDGLEFLSSGVYFVRIQGQHVTGLTKMIKI